MVDPTCWSLDSLGLSMKIPGEDALCKSWCDVSAPAIASVLVCLRACYIAFLGSWASKPPYVSVCHLAGVRAFPACVRATSSGGSSHSLASFHTTPACCFPWLACVRACVHYNLYALLHCCIIAFLRACALRVYQVYACLGCGQVCVCVCVCVGASLHLCARLLLYACVCVCVQLVCVRACVHLA